MKIFKKFHDDAHGVAGLVSKFPDMFMIEPSVGCGKRPNIQELASQSTKFSKSRKILAQNTDVNTIRPQ